MMAQGTQSDNTSPDKSTPTAAPSTDPIADLNKKSALSDQALRRIEEWKKKYGKTFFDAYRAYEAARPTPTKALATLTFGFLATKSSYIDELEKAATTEKFVELVTGHAFNDKLSEGVFKTVMKALCEYTKVKDNQTKLDAINILIDARPEMPSVIARTIQRPLTDALQAELSASNLEVKRLGTENLNKIITSVIDHNGTGLAEIKKAEENAQDALQKATPAGQLALRTELTKKHEETIAELTKKHSEALTAVEKSATEQTIKLVAEAKAASEKQLTELKATHKLEMEKLIADEKSRVNKLEIDHALKLEQHKTPGDSQLDAEKKTTADKIAMLTKSHTSEIAKLNEEHVKAIAQAKTTSETEIKSLRKKLLEEAEVSLNAKTEEMRIALEKEKRSATAQVILERNKHITALDEAKKENTELARQLDELKKLASKLLTPSKAPLPPATDSQLKASPPGTGSTIGFLGRRKKLSKTAAEAPPKAAAATASQNGGRGPSLSLNITKDNL